MAHDHCWLQHIFLRLTVLLTIVSIAIMPVVLGNSGGLCDQLSTYTHALSSAIAIYGVIYECFPCVYDMKRKESVWGAFMMVFGTLVGVHLHHSLDGFKFFASQFIASFPLSMPLVAIGCRQLLGIQMGTQSGINVI